MPARLGHWRSTYAGVCCPRCGTPLRHETLKTGDQLCRVCGGTFEAVRFDPVEPVVVVPDIAGTGPDGAAPCTRHARNQAEVACSRCGQFMCSLCRIDADQKAFCPSCYDRLLKEGTLPSTVVKVKNWAGWAGSLFLCSIIPFIGFITAIAGVVLSIKGVRDKRARQEDDGIVRLWITLMFNVLALAWNVFFVAVIFTAESFVP
jgi:hypothetical protein